VLEVCRRAYLAERRTRAAWAGVFQFKAEGVRRLCPVVHPAAKAEHPVAKVVERSELEGKRWLKQEAEELCNPPICRKKC